ncbi:hypothetical protein [Cellulomonas sp. URHB0016]
MPTYIVKDAGKDVLEVVAESPSAVPTAITLLPDGEQWMLEHARLLRSVGTSAEGIVGNLTTRYDPEGADE